jgi:hypothetical protein
MVIANRSHSADCSLSIVYIHSKYDRPTINPYQPQPNSLYFPGFSGLPTGASTVILITTSCAGILTSSISHSIPR